MLAEYLEQELRSLHSASFAWALACCGYQRDEAEDVLQSVYLKLIDGRARFHGTSSFKTWLFSVIRFTAREEHRQTLRERLGLARFGVHQVRQAAFVSSGPKPGAMADELSGLRAALKVLSTRQREVLELVFYHESTIEDAAVIMHVSIGTARTHYERGKRSLREKLQAR